ncbi:MAG: DUF2461 domain-containing protein [Myxococcales bacterium]|nr:DUF2461 domain-containing protein [Myxococcales bacterium]
MATAFPEALFAFLDDLAEHNDREWFAANKERYEHDVRDPALAFVEAFQGTLADVSPCFLAIPKVQGGSLFRIHRDTRFSKDKTPYKTHVALQFRHELASSDVHTPGFYLHLEPGGCAVGAGISRPPPPDLARLREAIATHPARWAEAREAAGAAGFTMMDGDDDLKRVPRGFDPAGPHVDDLRRKSLAVHAQLADTDVVTDGFAGRLAELYRGAMPVVAFVCDAVELPV